eukprot:8988038-Pyramimonas_sp.AAC.1
MNLYIEHLFFWISSIYVTKCSLWTCSSQRMGRGQTSLCAFKGCPCGLVCQDASAPQDARPLRRSDRLRGSPR